MEDSLSDLKQFIQKVENRSDMSVCLSDLLRSNNPSLVDGDFASSSNISKEIQAIKQAAVNQDVQEMNEHLYNISDEFYSPKNVVKSIFQNQAVFDSMRKQDTPVYETQLVQWMTDS